MKRKYTKKLISVRKPRHRKNRKSSRKRRAKVRKVRKKRFEWKLLILAMMLWIFLLGGYLSVFYSVTRVSGYGMIPNYRDKDVVVLSKNKEIKRFDVVKCDLGGGREVLLRVIGLAGDKVEYRDDDLFINDEQIDEKFIIDEINSVQKNGGIYTEDFTNQLLGDSPVVPLDSLLLFGDNRENSNDSRVYGYFSLDQIKGVVVYDLIS